VCLSKKTTEGRNLQRSGNQYQHETVRAVPKLGHDLLIFIFGTGSGPSVKVEVIREGDQPAESDIR
jgi:hypothetical protein